MNPWMLLCVVECWRVVCVCERRVTEVSSIIQERSGLQLIAGAKGANVVVFMRTGVELDLGSAGDGQDKMVKVMPHRMIIF